MCIYTWFNLGLGRSFFARVLGEPALFFLLRICCHTRPACKSLAGINDDRLQHMHACHARYTCSTRAGKNMEAPNFTCLLFDLLALILLRLCRGLWTFFCILTLFFSIILDLAGHVRYGQTTDEEVAQPMRCKHSGLILPAPKRRKNNSLNPAAKRLDNNLLLHNLSLNNSNFCQTESSVANMVPFTQRRNQKHFGGKTPYHRKLLEAN